MAPTTFQGISNGIDIKIKQTGPPQPFLGIVKALAIPRGNCCRRSRRVKIKRVSDTGRHKVIDTECSSGSIKILANASAEIPSESAHITFDQKYTYVYGDDWIIE